MPYFISVFAFIMLASSFVSSFIRPELSFIFAFIALFGCCGFLLFGNNFKKISVLFAAAVLGFGIVAFRVSTEFYPAKALDGITADISGKVTEISAGSGNPVYTVKTDSVNIEGAPQKLTVLLSGWEENSASEYDIIECSVTFRVFSEDDLSELMANRSKGVSVYAYTNSPIKTTGHDSSSLGYYVHLIRGKISDIIYEYFIDWHAPFAEQLLIGTKGELDSDIYSAFRKSGMSHILVISGMHMVIILGLFEKFLYLSVKGKFRKFIDPVLIIFTILYMLLGGMGMSVLRSGFMLIAHYFSKAFFSGSKSLDNLGIAVITVLLFNSTAACDAGFLMSTVTCASIRIFADPLKEHFCRLLKIKAKPFLEYMVEAFCVSSVAFLAVLPVSSIVFGEVSLVSPVSNLFAGFFAQYSIIFSLLTVVFAFVPFLGFIAGGTAFLAMLCNGMLFKTAGFFSGFSFSYIKIEDPGFYIWTFGAAALLLIPAIYSRSFRYIKHSVFMCAFALLFSFVLDYIFFGSVSEIKITALEHGTAVTFSESGNSVLIANGISADDRYNINFSSGDYDTVVSLNSASSSAEHELLEHSDFSAAFLSTEDSADDFENAEPVSPGKLIISENSFIDIIPGSAVSFETNGVTVLYIFAECDIMNIEPKFRRADIIILENVSPEDFPVLRSKYLVLRNLGGFYSGTNEIVTLKNGEISFFAFEGNLRKGWNAG